MGLRKASKRVAVEVLALDAGGSCSSGTWRVGRLDVGGGRRVAGAQRARRRRARRRRDRASQPGEPRRRCRGTGRADRSRRRRRRPPSAGPRAGRTVFSTATRRPLRRRSSILSRAKLSGTPCAAVGHLADDREHGALDGLLDGAVGGVAPRRSARALNSRRTERVRARPTTSQAPRTICERITPELPRAPMSEPLVIAAATTAGCRPRSRAASSSTMARRSGQVRARVAVGDRVHVEVVDRTAAPPRGRRGRRRRP